MKKKNIVLFVIISSLLLTSFSNFSTAKVDSGKIYEGKTSVNYSNTTVYAPAVARTENGYKGVISTITATIESNGTGRVFVDTLPLTQVDMQGSARQAVKVASGLVKRDKNCSVDPSNYNYYFVVRTSAPIIGGPSAGGVMTVATISLLEKWDISNSTVMTGMINPDGSIGPVGGITHKIDAAASIGATRFLIPEGQSTYIESVQENKGWISIQKTVTRDVKKYAMEGYGMEVREVSDVTEAIENFTGYGFHFDNLDEKISTEQYNLSMKPLATSLLNRAEQQLKDAKIELQDTDIPSGWFIDIKGEIKKGCTSAEERFNESKKWYNKKLFYTSTTKSFQSLIYSTYVMYACDFFKQEESNEYIERIINETERKYDNVSSKAKKEDIINFISLQCIGGAQSRISTAKSYLEEVKKTYKNNGLSSYSDILDLLYNLALVNERCNSVEWWINLSYSFNNSFNDSKDINIDTLQNLATEYINEAEQASTYSKIIIQESGESSNHLKKAESLLEKAREEKEKEYYASALFKSLEALTRANLAIETIGIDNESEIVDNIQRAEKSATAGISESREQGIEPVTAVSYYELAEAYKNESDLETALLYYKLSDMISGALCFTNTSVGTGSSRYVGIPERDTSSWNELAYGKNKLMLFEIFLIIMGIIGGVGIGLIIGGVYSKKQREKMQKKWIPKSIREHQRKTNYSDKREKEK